MLKWLAGLFAGLLMVGTAVAQTNPPDLKVTYLPENSFTAASRANAPAIVNRAARKSVRFFTAGADLTIRSDTPSIDFGGAIGVARYVRSYKRAPGDFTWVGAVEGDGRVLVVVRNGSLTGTISTPGGTHEILPLGNRLHALIAIEGAKFPPEHPNRPLPRPAKPRVIDKDAAARLRAGEAATVDVFIGYSTAAKSEYGGDMPAFAQSAIDDANTAYTDSGIDLQLRLVGTLEVTHTGTLDTALDDITDGLNGTAPILTAAANAGADMTSFFSASGSFCGQAWLFSADASNATSAVAWDCAVGNHSFAHELGHNFGARHDPFVDSSTTPYAYGHGYVYLAGAWRTIMAYNNYCPANGVSYCDRITRFSTPLKSYNSVATGTSATHDNARIHNDVAATVAAFRASPTFSLTVTRDEPGTVTSSPAGINCGATCSAGFSSGQNVTLTATPASNTTFSGWSGACTGSSSTCTVAMTAARAVTATFVRVQRTLTVAKAGTGTGTVTSSPAGISCGSACSKTFADGTNVTLTAAAASGSTFSGWSGACAGSSSTCTVAMTAARAVTATFTLAPQTLSVARTGSGTGTVASSPAGISCGSTCSASFANGTSVTLTATAASGSTFSGWSGACAGSSSTCTVAMTAARAVTATFVRVQRTLTVAKAGTGTGTVTSSPAGISCGSACSKTFADGTNVTLTAAAASGSTFSGWSGACAGSSSTCTVAMTAARAVTATFTLAPQTLSVARTGSGTGTVASSPAGISCGSTCSASFANGTSVTLTATAASGSTFSGWSGACAGSSSTCTVAMTAARAVTATFTLARQTLSVARAGGGTGTVTSSPAGISCGSTCSASFASGTSVTLTAAAASGSTFAGWSGACTGTASTCTVSMTAARSVTATFAVARRQLTVSRAGGGTGTVRSSPAGITCGPTCTATFVNGTTVTLTASPAAGSIFEKWSGACTGTAKTCTVPMTAARSVTATFRVKPLLTVARSGTGFGSVVSSPSGITCGATCSARFLPAASVTLTARPAAGSRFVQWTGSCTGTARTCRVVMSTNRTVRATFARP